ncbi:IS21 family transposase [Subtercola sp. PAMC28395]|uniref:IS21 family transposase n=1 Tax=Subtercola sp. PAMC28395 TaxID=2846775 RepID=UPI001C0C856E|nr:IS21 family transposase [Subtercola sp. PAMC28395]QWT23190.1 IS21 family transposase [Subtercola sp. PAMC28395]QWT24214.1 IS21 family transposase [Subtercola sp. PAMC28395]QWT24873.1 IS21 family transposase [Subtercola sp. PAMC28395]QWT25107.1 IS21 family transposase [Subtercola sp. PAMC28395]
MITVEDWALIRRLHKGEGLSQREIAKRLGLARDTVAKAISTDGPPKYVRPPRPSEVRDLEPAIRELLKAYPRMPATVIAERLGWQGSITWFRQNVARLRPEYAPADPADRLSYRPGDQAQCDLWFPPVKIPLGHGQTGSPPVLVIVPSNSRFITAMMLPTRTTPDLLAGMWELLQGQLGAVPHRLIWDNEAGIGRRNSFAEGVASFTGTLATRIVQLKPFDPESKGIVERANQYLETSFLPGRTFTSPADFNDQLVVWLRRANNRQVRRLAAKPSELIGVDRAAMVPLPPIAPNVGFSSKVRLPRDYYVTVLGNDYSVDPAGIGRMVDVRANLRTVTVTLDGKLLAQHDRVWARGQSIADPTHVGSAKTLRTLFQTRTPAVPERYDRDLADYDQAFGVSFDPAGEVA